MNLMDIRSPKYDANIERYGYNEFTCEVCGKELKEIKYWFSMDTDCEIMLDGDMGMYPVGTECVKKIPKDLRIHDDENKKER